MRHPFHAPALLTFAALTLATLAPADAAFLGGTQGIADLGAPSANDADLTLANRFNFGGMMTTFTQGGGFVGAAGMALAASPLDLGDIGAFGFGSASFGTFAATSFANILAIPTTRQLDIAGTFTPGSMFGAGLAPVAADFKVSFTEGQAGLVMDVSLLSAAAAVDPTAVPEPASAALLATGLIGGVVVRRRRMSK